MPRIGNVWVAKSLSTVPVDMFKICIFPASNFELEMTSLRLYQVSKQVLENILFYFLQKTKCLAKGEKNRETLFTF